MTNNLTISDHLDCLMRTISVTKAKAQFTSVIRAAEGGETLLISRDGKTVAEIHPPNPVKAIDWEAGDRYWRDRGIDPTGIILPDDFNEARGIDGLE
jgi:antitoxin (DNA-binding transcriptional repressor) of toxin-antitoxin stability system